MILYTTKKASTTMNFDDLKTPQDKIDFLENIEPFHDSSMDFAEERDICINLRSFAELTTIEDDVYLYFIRKVTDSAEPEKNLERLLVAFRKVISPEHFGRLMELILPSISTQLPSHTNISSLHNQ